MTCNLAPLFRILPACLIASLFLGCASQNNTRLPEQDDIAQAKPAEILRRAKKLPRPGEPPFKELLQPLSKNLASPQRLFTLSFAGAPLAEALTALTNDGSLNLAVDADVDMSRPVTVRLRQVPFAEAMDMVVEKGAGYAWTVRGSTLRIRRFTERLYSFDYLDMVGETSVEVGGDMLASSVEGSGVAGKYQIKGEKKSKQTDIWSALEESLAKMKSPDGILQVNRHSGTIYLADTPARMGAMTGFLDAIIDSLHRQVLIDAKILEVRLKDSFKFGIDWEVFTQNFLGVGDLSLATDFATGRTGFFTMQFSGDTGKNIVGNFLEALSTQGDITVLSNPHLAVLNGQSALMTVGFQFPYGDITGVDRNTETNTITYGTSIKRVILGLQLGITPQISKDGLVALHIVPTITRIQGKEAVDIPTSSTTTQTISNPVIDLQEMATTIRVQSGRTVVLAGLISKVNSMDHKGVPWLNRLPIVGGLFKGFEDEKENRELVIVMTPYVKEKDL